MACDNRLTQRNRHSYRTKVKTPGGRLVFQTLAKKGHGPRCGDCKEKLHGIPELRPIEYSRIGKHRRTVSRAYGGNRCGRCVRERIIRAFLIEEQRIVKRVLKAQQQAVTKAEKK